MSKPVVEVQVRAVAATSGGYAVFLGNEDKVFVMFVDQGVGTAIAMFMQGTRKERPLTHDLLASILQALGAKIERVIVNDLKRSTYFARLVLSASGNFKSKNMRSNLCFPRHLMASFAVPTTSRLKPIFFKNVRNRSCTRGSSSTTNTVG